MVNEMVHLRATSACACVSARTTIQHMCRLEARSSKLQEHQQHQLSCMDTSAQRSSQRSVDQLNAAYPRLS